MSMTLFLKMEELSITLFRGHISNPMVDLMKL
jgi:hypothetical protein